MALTTDEIKEILELRARSYSYRKIAGKTGHSETTVRKAVVQAEERAKSLATEGLTGDQITSQLDYPLLFVASVMERWQVQQEKVPKVDTEESRPSQKPDIKAEWEKFEKKQEVERGKELLKEKVHTLTSGLEQIAKEMRRVGIADKDWHKRKQPLENALTNFVVQQIDGIDSGKDLPVLEGVVSGIEKEIQSLSQEYKYKIKEAIERLRRQEKSRSDQLLDQHIDMPLFPDFVREYIKNHFAVKDDKDACVVADAMHHFAILIAKKHMDDPEKEQKMWREFINFVEVGGWAYLNEMAAEGRQETERFFVSINICPQCESQLTRSREQGGEIVTCPSCGVSWAIRKKKAPI